MPNPEVKSNGQAGFQGRVKAAILYPALGSPEVTCGNQPLHIVLCLEQDLAGFGTRAKIFLAHRLKFLSIDDTRLLQLGMTESLDAHDPFPEDLILDFKALDLSSAPYKVAVPETGFSATLNPATVDFFRTGKFGSQQLPADIHGGLSKIYLVSIKPEIFAWIKENVDPDLASKCFVNWLSTGQPLIQKPSDSDMPRETEEKSVTWLLRNFADSGRHLFIGPHVKAGSDKALKELTGVVDSSPTICVYNVFNFEFHAFNPLAPLHPVFHYAEAFTFNVAYISDLHVVSRLQVLKQSNLRVIPGIQDDASPLLADQLSATAESVRSLISKADVDDEIDALVVGGDLIDFAQSCFPGNGFLSQRGDDGKIDFKKVQAKVNASADNFPNLYDHGVDYMSIFLMLTNFSKPVFVIAGNHDSYDMPFGISPRVISLLANEGIPADGNLTIMEACLLYGNNFDLIAKKFNFNPKIAELFHLIITPITALTSRIGTVQWIALDWGDDEDMLWDGPKLIPGHLLNANKSMTNTDLDIINFGVDSGKGQNGITAAPCLLLTHYTWACSEATESLLDGKTHSLPLGDHDNNTWDNVGTCMLNRGPVYDHLKKLNIRWAISGHAHRAGLYMLDSIHGNNALIRGFKVESFADELEKGAFDNKPMILVSDSAGPIPRENNSWEFGGWGSNRPSMLKLVFSESDLVKVQRVPANTTTCKPRLAVAMDYVEVMNQPFYSNPLFGYKFWLNSMESEEFGTTDEDIFNTSLDSIPFKIGFGKFTKKIDGSDVNLISDGIELVHVNIHLLGNLSGSKPFRIFLFKDELNRWFLHAAALILFLRGKNLNISKCSGFASINLQASLGGLQAYDDKLPWVQRINFEISSQLFNKKKWKVKISRDADWLKMSSKLVLTHFAKER